MGEGRTFEFGTVRGVDWASCNCSASVIMVVCIFSLCAPRLSFFRDFFLRGWSLLSHITAHRVSLFAFCKTRGSITGYSSLRVADVFAIIGVSFGCNFSRFFGHPFKCLPKLDLGDGDFGCPDDDETCVEVTIGEMAINRTPFREGSKHLVCVLLLVIAGTVCSAN